MLPLAHIAIGELSGLIVALGTILGYLYRISRRLLMAAERNLQAIADNATINRQLAQRLAEMQRTMNLNTSRINQLEATQRGVRETVEGEIVPRLADVQEKVTNGG